jgi:hypothetical protein
MNIKNQVRGFTFLVLALGISTNTPALAGTVGKDKSHKDSQEMAACFFKQQRDCHHKGNCEAMANYREKVTWVERGNDKERFATVRYSEMAARSGNERVARREIASRNERFAEKFRVEEYRNPHDRNGGHKDLNALRELLEIDREAESAFTILRT